MRSPVRLLLIAQLCLFAGLLICVLLMPHFLFEANEGGVSNYGTYAKTVVPYTLGFGGCGIITIQAALRISRKDTSRKLLLTLGLLYLFVLLSTYPYKLDGFYHDVHELAGAALVIYTVAFGMWLSLRKTRSTPTLLLFTAQCLSFLLAALTYTRLIHILFIAEFLVSTAFGTLLICSFKQLASTDETINK